MSSDALYANGSSDSSSCAFPASMISLGPARGRAFPPDVALHIVKIACELPDEQRRSLAFWDCMEIARELQEKGIVESISAETVRRTLAHHKLKPWRHHLWLSPKVPRDDAFCTTVRALSDLYTRALSDDERVISVDEMTSLQPRPRTAPTFPPAAGQPARVEHEYKRKGALNLFAGLDTRSGHVYGMCAQRKRASEFISFLAMLDREIPASVRLIHVVLDNSRAHRAKLVQAWLAKNPRFRLFFLPVHCSWMNQVEQWFSTLQRKRLIISNFASLVELEEKIMAFISQHNKYAAPHKWTKKSFAKVLAKAEARTAALAA